MERRTFLSAATGASFGLLFERAFAREKNGAQAAAGQSSLETAQVEVSENKLFIRRYGKGPAILLVHGFPRTSLMWRLLAPKLCGESHRDLRRPSCLRPQWNARVHRRPLCLFKARHGQGTGRGNG